MKSSLAFVGAGGPPPDTCAGDHPHTHRSAADVLTGARVLLVEDEFLIATLLEEMLRDFGCEVAATAPRVAQALEIIGCEPLDAAILDVNLAGEVVFPVADALSAASIPYVFSTSYGRAGVLPRFAARPVLEKPYPPHALERVLRLLLTPASTA